MVWQGILGHDDVAERFRRALAAGRLASTFLFVGPEGVGKRAFAEKLAQGLLCEASEETLLEPCGTCAACKLVLVGNHPDLEIIAKPEGKSELPLELFIGDREHRMREGLCHNISLKPMRGKRKVAVIDDADDLNEEGANCLLKTLEEPPPRSVLILIGTSRERQLPTIRSRCQLVTFAPLAAADVERLLVEKNLVPNRTDAARVATICGGSLARAVQLADAEVAEFRRDLERALAGRGFDAAALAERATEFVDAAGKEAPPRRRRLRLAIEFAVEIYRQAARDLAESIPGELPVEHAEQIERYAAAVERCMDAAHEIDANANLSTLIACWCDDLAELTRAGIMAAR